MIRGSQEQLVVTMRKGSQDFAVFLKHEFKKTFSHSGQRMVEYIIHSNDPTIPKDGGRKMKIVEYDIGCMASIYADKSGIFALD